MGNPRLSSSILYSFLSLSSDIQILNLSRCNLKYLSRSIGLCQALIELNLSDNELTILPPQLAGLFSLRILNISNNHFKKITSLRPVASLTLFSFFYEGNPVTSILNNLLAEKQIEDNINNSKFHFLKIKEIIEGQVPKTTILNQVRICLVGPSMTGKSTLAKLLPYSMQPKKLKKQIQFVKSEIAKVESMSSDEDVDDSLEKQTEGEVSIHIAKWNVDLKDFEIVRKCCSSLIHHDLHHLKSLPSSCTSSSSPSPTSPTNKHRLYQQSRQCV
jgi:Leucine-rich repeat (LRR) protein